MIASACATRALRLISSSSPVDLVDQFLEGVPVRPFWNSSVVILAVPGTEVVRGIDQGGDDRAARQVEPPGLRVIEPVS